MTRSGERKALQICGTGLAIVLAVAIVVLSVVCARQLSVAPA